MSIQPVKGMHQDFDPINQPPNTTRYVLNGQLTKDGAEVSSEYGFLTLQRIGFSTPDFFDNVPIGHCVVDDNTIILFSVKNPYINIVDSGEDEIGLLTRDGKYTTIIRDSILNFSMNHPIQTVHRRNYKDEIVVYWTDYNNPFRFLNTSTPQLDIDASTYNLVSDSDISKLNVFSSSQPAVISLTGVNDFGGACKTGVYYLAVQYEDSDGNATDFVTISNPVSVVKDKRSAISGTPPTNYSGEVADTDTSKSITFSLSNLDSSYDFIRLAIIPKINGSVTSPKLLNKISLNGSTTLSYTFTNLESFESTTIDEIIIPKSRYSKIKTITQVNDQLFIGNLESNADIGMQKYANLISVDYVTKTLDINNNSNLSHSNEYYIYNNKGFLQDEVYALYISYILNDGTESLAYHIPGRKAVEIDQAWNTSNYLENALLQTLITSATPTAGVLASMDENKLIDLSNPVDPTTSRVRYFHIYDTASNTNATNLHGVIGLTSNMGYWENRDETYPFESDWDSSGISGDSDDDLQGSKIRHHKIPSINDEFKDSTNSEFKVVGLKLKNVIIPSDKRDQIKYIKVYYAKRTLGSSTVLGYSLITPQGQNATGGAWYNSLGVYASVALDGTTRGGPAGTYTYGQETSLQGYRLNNFELLYQKTDLSSATHLKQNYMLTTPMTAVGGLDYPATVICNALGIFLDYTDAAATYDSMLSTDVRYRFYSFRLNNCFYFANNTPNVNALQINSTQYGTLRNVHNYWGEEHILAELVTAPPTAVPPGFGGLYPVLVDGSAAAIQAQANLQTGLNYLGQICAYKANVYSDFSIQELVDTGFLYSIPVGSGTLTIDDTTTAPDIGDGKLFGGDAFICGYGFRNTGNCDLDLTSGTFTEPEFNISTTHWFPCLSTANINFRNKGTSTTDDTWYPKNNPNATFLVTTFDKTNFIDYNIDYSSVNNLKELVINPPYVSNKNTIFKNRVARSAKQDKLSVKDNYRIFDANDFRDLNRNRGEVESLETDGNRLIVHLTRALVRTTPQETLKTDNISAYIGQGDIFDIDPKEILYTDNGYAGTQSLFAGCITPYGYIFPDAEAGRIFKISDTLDEISNHGLFNYLSENLPLKLYEQVRSILENTNIWIPGAYGAGSFVIFKNKIYLCVTNTSAVPDESTDWEELIDLTTKFINTDNTINRSTCGIIAAWDNQYKRYILHKRDYEIIGDITILPYSTNYTSWNIGDYIIKDGCIFRVIDTPAFNLPDDFIVVNNITEYKARLVDLATDDNFKDISFTLSYYPELGCWGSFHSYKPDWFIYSNKDLYSTKESNSGSYWVYRHNYTPAVLNFYTDDVVPVYDRFIVELVYNEANNQTKSFDSVSFISKALRTSNNTEIIDYTFNKGIVYNANQCSGYIDLTDTDNCRMVQSNWNLNNYRDLIDDYTLPFMVDNELDETNIDYNKVYYERKRMTENYLQARYILDDSSGTIKVAMQISDDKVRKVTR